jgi:hypothetical protein
MAKVTRHNKGTAKGLRFRCGGYTKLDGDALPPGVDPEATAIMVLEGEALVPCYESVVLSLGHRGRIDMKHLHRALEAAGWLLGEVSPEMIQGNVAVCDPMCPTHGSILAARLMNEPGTPAHVIAHLTGYLRRATEALVQREMIDAREEAEVPTPEDEPLAPVTVDDAPDTATDGAPAAP